MSLQLLKFTPGVVKDITEYSAGKSGPYYIDSDLIRFRNGFPTKIGGWEKDIFNALNADGTVSNTATTIEGIARRILSWRATDGADRMVISTHNHLFIIQDSGLYDITPLRDKTNAATTTTEALDDSENAIDLTSVTGFKTAGAVLIGTEVITYTGISTLTLTGCTRGADSTTAAAHDSGATVTQILIDPITTADTTTTVTITDTGHGALKGDWVVFDGAVATGGIAADTLNSRAGYQITAVTTNTFTIVSLTAATSTVSAGGGNAIVISYLIGSAAGLGIQSADPALGFGAGAWGDSTWGTARIASASNVGLESSCWSLNLWDTDVLAQVRNGGLYYWSVSGGVTTRAVLIADESDATAVPTIARISTVSFPNKHSVCGGTDPFVASNSTSSGTLDPMLVRWSSDDNFVDWAVTTDNTAGDQRLQIGTKIIAMVASREEIIISTDLALYGMTFVGGDFVFSFRLLATEVGAAGINTMINIDNTVYWMGTRGFFRYTGVVEELPCPVKHFVFSRMRLNYQDKTIVGNNKKHSECTWYYPSDEGDTDNPEPDSYVTFNYLEQAWTIGSLARTAWSDSIGFRSVPFAFDKEGYLYNQETGTTADGAAMNSFVETSPRELTESGDNLYLVDKIIPDVTMSATTNLYVELNTKKYPNSTKVTKGPFTVTSSTTKLSTRAKGRQISMKIYSTGTEDEWSLGDFRLNATKDSLR
jgi:hypothetical protein|tara:strand:+ start:1041 stop:3164 length:2124 start_codon:yes stop_codon:yes gene_type:complete